MTTLVLGHLVLDEIHSYEGKVYESAGGITFPLKTFAALAGDADTILPVFPFGTDAAEITAQFSIGDPSIDTSQCWQVETGTTRVRLFHESSSSYNTQLVRSLESIPFERFGTLLERSRLVYLNLMTGEDIRLEDALKLKGDGRLVYIDLHMIAYRVLENGHRRPAPSEDWKTWITAGDVLQCNAHEFDALSGTSRPLRERLEELFLCAAPVAFVLTRGEDGADIYTSPDDYLHIAAIPPVKTVDPTGCGDAFGSTFAWGLAQGDSHEAAAQRAAFAASFVATLPGSVGIEKLRGHLAGVGT